MSGILLAIYSGVGSKWMNARGWSCYTSKGNTAADALATCFCEAAATPPALQYSSRTFL